MSERIWIMGASDSIGAALARHCAARSARLILSARRAGALEAVAADCPGATVIVADVAGRATLTEAAARIAARGRWTAQSSLPRFTRTAKRWRPTLKKWRRWLLST
ncbi:MAG: SDR family NAD(P)-dependent oxidoreductase [Paracoccus sp. (in: a-proteobacteria)]|nr:SDR family NAD(P)-dependent oxidoreductase [Paracoccus sp. (in: a-proteobacteria)]